MNISKRKFPVRTYWDLYYVPTKDPIQGKNMVDINLLCKCLLEDRNKATRGASVDAVLVPLSLSMVCYLTTENNTKFHVTFMLS